jgi:hypothetical protein
VTAAPIQVIIDARTGKIDAIVPGVGAGDEVWFNPGSKLLHRLVEQPVAPDRGRRHCPDRSGARRSSGVIGARNKTLAN